MLFKGNAAPNLRWLYGLVLVAFGATQLAGAVVRVPCTSSHVVGSPDAPLPYQTRRAYPRLTFVNPLDIAFDGAGHRVYIAEQAGKIYSFPDDPACAKADLLLDPATQIHGWEHLPFCDGFTGVYGIALHPGFSENHYIYVCYALDFKAPPGHARLTPADEQGTHVSRFTVIGGDHPRIDPASEKIIITWFAGGHNGGCLKFGPDGCLYISTGDGGDPDPPDPFDTGQDISDLLCSILRVDVDHPDPDKPYSIPKDNPFVHTPGARGEVYAYGLRNPWRMSFDRLTGNLWVGDVGWELYESVQCVKPGGNYGWSIMEGPNPVHPHGKRGPTPITPPMLSLSHAEAASLTGGVVYRGKALPKLTGYYVFGDWQTTRLWAAKCDGDKLEPYRTIAQTDQRIVAFGERPDGELVIVDHQGGGLWDIVPNEQAAARTKFPRLLSETGLFTSVSQQTPAPGVYPFAINAAQWLDGATARRWIAVPGAARMTWGKGLWGDDKPAWPKDSVLVRTISLPLGAGDAKTLRNVETQILYFDGKQWNGYSYAWNDQQTDAKLVEGDGGDLTLQFADSSAPSGVGRRRWRIGSRAQCLTCHNVWCDYALAFNAPQLDRAGGEDQVDRFRRLGLLLGAPSSGQITPPPGGQKLTLANPYDPSADLGERVRSYLHVNCSHCHRYGGGGSALFDVRKELPLDRLNLINVRPNLGDFGIEDARLVCPGDPNRSVLLYRMSKLGRGRMPHIDSDIVDAGGVELMRQWIAGMAPAQTTPAAAQSAAERAQLLKQLKDPATPAAAADAAADRLLSSTAGALALAGAMEGRSLSPAAFALASRKGIANSKEFVHDLFRPFDPSEQNADRLGPQVNAARLLAIRGDAARGKIIFFGQGGAGTALCARCHRAAGAGTDFGPDLSHIASKYNRADLLDNILFPSKTIAPGFATYVCRTKDGDTVSGFLLKKDGAEVVLKDAQLKEIHIPTGDVDRLAAQTVSAMPEGLLSDLTPQQAADLLEFLETQK